MNSKSQLMHIKGRKKLKEGANLKKKHNIKV